MKIAQVSKADSSGGGASRVAEELNGKLTEYGYVSDHWVSWAGKGFNETRKKLYGKFDRLTRRAHWIGKKLGFPETVPFELVNLWVQRISERYDLFHFHDISSAISPRTLMFLAKNRPVVWTIHDCSPFTGGCLYPFSCERFKIGCGDCPQLGHWPLDTRFDRTRFLWKEKKKIQENNVRMVTPSKWMSDIAFSSGMFDEPPKVISNGVDLRAFYPRQKDQLRLKLGIPVDRLCILISAGNVLDERKGTVFAISALREIAFLRPFLIVVGNLDEHGKKLFSEFDIWSSGYVADQAYLADIYSCADFFLFCSLADNQPLSILETMACGVPMIGFQTGGIPEMVESRRNGMLVPQKDIAGLVEAIKYGVLERRVDAWSQECITDAQTKYSIEIHVKNHISLYQELIESSLLKNV